MSEIEAGCAKMINVVSSEPWKQRFCHRNLHLALKVYDVKESNYAVTLVAPKRMK
jgi:hypothetical protein